jgi:hypothetical protein
MTTASSIKNGSNEGIYVCVPVAHDALETKSTPQATGELLRAFLVGALLSSIAGLLATLVAGYLNITTFTYWAVLQFMSTVLLSYLAIVFFIEYQAEAETDGGEDQNNEENWNALSYCFVSGFLTNHALMLLIFGLRVYSPSEEVDEVIIHMLTTLLLLWVFIVLMGLYIVVVGESDKAKNKRSVCTMDYLEFNVEIA